MSEKRKKVDRSRKETKLFYACEFPHRYKTHTNKKSLERDFNKYLKQGKARKISGSTSNLYVQRP
ncbi:hypothetical protein F3K53_29145 [Pseudomonas veronii]|uniref:Uncharacterized protein n=1 Tax=Pseudomonas veronii TaxID=76761 RepID=A0A5M8E9W9_PSEVE|nr:hypothetical protein F3K54_30125 [Pseudomonas veronii]KAA6169707.1 hypothetical protein F3K53_29145 [Pseudomonas veronii]